VLDASPCIFDNVIKHNYAYFGDGIAVQGGAPYIHHNVIRDNHGKGGVGIGLGQVGSALIEANQIEDNGWGPYDAAVLVDGYGHPTILRNIIRGNHGVGVFVGGPAKVLGNLITDNIGYQSGGIYVEAQYKGEIVDVANNTVVDNTGGAELYVAAQKGGVARVANNIFASPHGHTINCSVGGDGTAKFTDNLAHRQGGAGTEGNCDLTSGGLLSEDPKFVGGTGAKQYRLQAASPAIDAGSDVAASRIKRDLSGKPRIQGASVDLGAYEFPGN
jgi:hypothetical protein